MKTLLLLVAFAALMPGALSVCLWDYDTLAMERQKFPDAHELIAGHFVRHSDAYYEWRISDRMSKPVEDRTPLDFDDIAVAHDKLGEHDKAIEFIEAKIKRWPNEQRYQSEANLGTFHIHAGRFEEGLPHINRAIEINPDAHFGREIYQQLLVRYVIENRDSRQPLPIELEENLSFTHSGFAKFVLSKRHTTSDEREKEIDAATKGILGMMRFGQHDSPVLLEALGDLLFLDGTANGSKMLATRAYLRASYVVDDPEVSNAYRAKARNAISLQFGRELEDIESELKQEIMQGEELFLQISQDERDWIAANKNLDAEFQAKYYEDAELTVHRPNWRPMSQFKKTLLQLLAVLTVLSMMGIGAFVALRKFKRATRL